MVLRQTGVVFNFDPKRGFGHLSVNGRPDTSISRVFFHAREVELDIVGRRCIPAGSPVSFEISPIGKNGSDEAVHVRNIDPALEDIDPNDCEEYGKVRSWNGEWGYVVRPSGDGLRFDSRHVISVGLELIQVGTVLHYFIGCVRNDDGTVAWFARDVSVCEPEPEPLDNIENYFLHAEELPLSEHVPVRKPKSVLLPSTRKLTLLEIIKRRN